MGERTEVLHSEQNVVNTVLQFTSKTKSRIDACIDYTRPSLVVEIEQLRKAFLDAKNRAVRLRCVTEITEDNIGYCKELMKIVDELRHIDGIKGNFYLSETEYIAPATLHEKGKPASQIIYSNVKEIVEHQQYVFDSFWSRAIPAERRIKEIEDGIKPDIIEVIQDSSKAKELYLNLVKDAAEEIMVIFPTINAFIRQEKIGVIQSLIDAANKRNLKIRILMPSVDNNFTNNYNNGNLALQLNKQIQQATRNNIINIRYTEQISENKATLLIADRKVSLLLEVNDDSKQTFEEAFGLSIYSNSLPGVLSYVSIFESLWKQSELYQQVKNVNEQLKMHDKMQKEFINVAAHELRTPIQPILGLTELMYSKMDENGITPHKRQRQKEMLEVVIRNANRLQHLTEDILDVTRIESQNLNLKLERLNLNEIISNAINDAKRSQQIKNVRLLHQHDKDNIVFIQADKGRLNQVIFNLITNAIKFTKEGFIIITSKKEEKEDKVMVSVKDSGIGIHPEILSRLFQKFATKSYQGTGLGLYISKSIVEAHGGKMWAENNKDGKGCTFYFTLPIV
jgi:two-component system, OmpR family, sensor histidine kinase VicK